MYTDDKIHVLVMLAIVVVAVCMCVLLCERINTYALTARIFRSTNNMRLMFEAAAFIVFRSSLFPYHIKFQTGVTIPTTLCS